MASHGAIEVTKTVLEVAEVAWAAIECHHHHHNHNKSHDHGDLTSEEVLQSARCENQRLRDLLEQNLKLLQNLAESPSFAKDCPPDLYERLAATLESKSFLNRIDNLKQSSANGNCDEFPFRKATGADLQSAEIPIKVDQENSSWWVWITDEMVPSNVEEESGIDDENYVVITEEHVVDGVATFMARCIIANPKAQRLSPEELQKTLEKALAGVSKVEKMMSIWHAGKMFYALSTWGLALTGLYRSRAVLKLVAIGAHKTGKLILKAL